MLLKGLLLLWLACEVAFVAVAVCCLQLGRAKRRRRAALPAPLPPLAQVAAAAAQLTAHLCGVADEAAARAFFTGWFCGTTWASLRVGNVDELLAASLGLFGVRQLPPPYQAAVSGVREAVEARWGFRFESGHDPALRLLPWFGHILTPLHKPLAFYALLKLANAGAALALNCLGFRHVPAHSGSQAQLPHWVRRAPLQRSGSSEELSRPPVICLPGVGVGLVQYLALWVRLAFATCSSTIAIIELPNVTAGVSFCKHAPSVEDLALAVLEVQDGLGLGPAHYVAHSYGTFVMARLLQLRPKAVCGTLLLDCTSIMSFSPEPGPVQLVQPPRLGLLWRDPFSFLAACVRAAVVRDYGTYESLTSSRMPSLHVMLWPHMLPDSSVVQLAEHDDLVPATQVVALFAAAKHPAKVLIIPGAAHGKIMMSGRWQRCVLEAAGLAGEAHVQEAAELHKPWTQHAHLALPLPSAADMDVRPLLMNKLHAT